MKNAEKIVERYTQLELDKNFETHVYSLLHDEIVVRKDVMMVAQKIALETFRGKSVSKTELIYELRIPQSSMTILLADLIEIKYIKKVSNAADKRHSNYQATGKLKKGMELGFLRDLASWTEFACDILPQFEAQIRELAVAVIEIEPGDIFKPYGEFSVEDLGQAIRILDSALDPKKTKRSKTTAKK